MFLPYMVGFYIGKCYGCIGVESENFSFLKSGQFRDKVFIFLKVSELGGMIDTALKKFKKNK